MGGDFDLTLSKTTNFQLTLFKKKKWAEILFEPKFI